MALLIKLILISSFVVQGFLININAMSRNQHERRTYSQKYKSELCQKAKGDLIVDFRFDQKSGKCYEVGFKGPCGSNLLFYRDPESQSDGSCDCNRQWIRTLIHHKPRGHCYEIFKQAFCSEGQWLTLSRKTGKPICEVNPCANIRTGNSNEFVVFNGRCVELGKQAHECGKLEVVRFVKNKILPRCATPFGGYGVGTIDKNPEPCALNTLRSLSGGCQKSWEW